MKLENETGFVQTPPRKSYNPFESDDEDTDNYAKINVNTYDISFENNDERLSFHLENGDISWEEAILGKPAILSDDDVSCEENYIRKDTELFTDKNVMECELPELMVCYKENGHHHSVKDIGIDEGVPTNEEVWIKSKDIHGIESLSTTPKAFNGDINGGLSLENKHKVVTFIQDGAEDSMKCSRVDSEDLERHNSANQCENSFDVDQDDLKLDLSETVLNSSRKSEGDKMKTGGFVNDTKIHGLSDINVLNHAEVEKMSVDSKDQQLSKTDEVAYVEVEKKGNDIFEQERLEDDVSFEHDVDVSSSAKPSMMDGGATIAESSESLKKEPTSSQSPENSASQEAASSSICDYLSYDSKVESASIILDFNSSTISEKQEEEKERTQPNLIADKPPELQNIPSVEKPPKPQTMSRNDDKAPGMDKWVHGETSFSADMPPPASIIYTGSNARCGSISLRSESSAGSTRSFAFPVLQAEWNSSPVRMAKADQRHLHKHRGWVHSLMCCRF